MTLDDIPADTTLTLTDELDRLFKAVGCNPTCHACGHTIELGQAFMLLSLDGMDEMLCHECDREALILKKERDVEKREILMEGRTGTPSNGTGWSKRGGGYSRPSQV